MCPNKGKHYLENHRLTTLAYGMEDLGGFKVSRVPSWFQFSKFDISTPKDARNPSALAFSLCLLHALLVWPHDARPKTAPSNSVQSWHAWK